MVKDISPNESAFVQIKTAMYKIENRTEDGTLIVLKGHLVVEELLRAKLEKLLKSPEYIARGGFTFFQVLCLARGLMGDIPAQVKEGEKEVSIWDLVEAWNTLRNRLAHRLAPTDTAQILRRIIYWVPDFSRPLEDDDTQNCLSLVRGMIIGAIGNHGEEPAAKQPENKSGK